MTASTSTALIIILHGSPRQEANEPAYILAKHMGLTGQFQHIVVAYMECNSPSISEAVDQCAAAGMQRVVALPWFLHAGRHLVLDVPAILMKSAEQHPQMQVLITAPVGDSSLVAGALSARAKDAKPLTL